MFRAFSGKGSPRDEKAGDTASRNRRRGAAKAGAGDGDASGWLARQAERITFERFERVLYALTCGVVLAGCAILVGYSQQQPAAELMASAEPETKVAAPQLQAAAPVPETSAAEPSAPDRPQLAAAQNALPIQAAPALRTAPVVLPPATEPARKAEKVPTENPDHETRAKDARRDAPAPAASREELAASREETASADPAPLSYAPAAHDAEKASARSAVQNIAQSAAGEHVSHCFVKVAGRVLNNGTCRISHHGSAVTLRYGGASVAVSPHQGREWTLTMSGRNVGKVYRSGACWGANNHTWVCEKGV